MSPLACDEAAPTFYWQDSLAGSPPCAPTHPIAMTDITRGNCFVVRIHPVLPANRLWDRSGLLARCVLVWSADSHLRQSQFSRKRGLPVSFDGSNVLLMARATVQSEEDSHRRGTLS